MARNGFLEEESRARERKLGDPSLLAPRTFDSKFREVCKYIVLVVFMVVAVVVAKAMRNS